jgi:hypothetical protein
VEGERGCYPELLIFGSIKLKIFDCDPMSFANNSPSVINLPSECPTRQTNTSRYLKEVS